MSKHYENILKEQIMQTMLGNQHQSTKQLLTELISSNQHDATEILLAYKAVATEIVGNDSTF